MTSLPRSAGPDAKAAGLYATPAGRVNQVGAAPLGRGRSARGGGNSRPGRVLRFIITRGGGRTPGPGIPRNSSAEVGFDPEGRRATVVGQGPAVAPEGRRPEPPTGRRSATHGDRASAVIRRRAGQPRRLPRWGARRG